MVWVCIGVHCMCNHVFEGTINAQGCIEVKEWHWLPSRFCLIERMSCLFLHENVKPYFVLLQQYDWSKAGSVLSWCAWSPSLSPFENVWYIKKLSATMETLNCWSSKILHQTKMRKHLTSKIIAVDFLSFQMLMVLLKENLIQEIVKHDYQLRYIILNMHPNCTECI